MGAVGVTKSKLSDQRFVIFGAGSAGSGIAMRLRDAMVKADDISENDASGKFWLVDRYGLIKQSLGNDKIRDNIRAFVRPDDEWHDVADADGKVDLLEVVKKVKPTVLIGCSTKAGAFTEEVIKTMSRHCERPIILPLSNPGRLVEVEPEQAMKWSNGKALIAAGSPFPPMTLPNGRKYLISQCNNAIIYPGLGFGALLSKPRKITDRMIIAGAQRLASLSPALRSPDEGLLPDFEDAPHVNFEIAVAVAETAVEEGISTAHWVEDVKAGKATVRQLALEKLWVPAYCEYVYDSRGDM
jgi:malate dehydrogenase (oxaloacetate-decarboxylating)